MPGTGSPIVETASAERSRAAERRDASGAEPADGAAVEIPIERLEPDPFQPRTVIAEEKVRELAASIEQHGILQPLLVRPKQGPNSRGKYWIVAGERRYRAAQLLGLKTLPCRVRDYEHMAAAVVALAENVHRVDLSEIDKAAALLRIKMLTDRTWDEVAELVRLSRDYVKRLAGLLKLEDSVREHVRLGKIPIRTAIALRPLPPRRQAEMAERILQEGLTAEQVRQEVATRKRLRGRASASDEPEAEDAPRERRRRGPKGSVLESLAEHAQTVQEIDGWIGGREWAPSRVSEQQKQRLDELYEAVSLLQQRLAVLRRPLREESEPEAERLRRAPPPRANVVHGELPGRAVAARAPGPHRSRRIRGPRSRMSLKALNDSGSRPE